MENFVNYLALYKYYHYLTATSPNTGLLSTAFIFFRYTILSPENLYFRKETKFSQVSLLCAPCLLRPDGQIFPALPRMLGDSGRLQVCFRVNEELVVNHFSFTQNKEKNKGFISAISNLSLQ